MMAFSNINVFQTQERQVNDNNHVLRRRQQVQSLMSACEVFQRSGSNHVNRVLDGGCRWKKCAKIILLFLRTTEPFAYRVQLQHRYT